MKTLVSLVLLAAAGCALAGRLENTYLPPAGAAQAGGSNLATPFQAPLENTYLPPTGSGSTAVRAGSSGSSFNSGSAFNSGSSFNSGNAYNSGSALNSGNTFVSSTAATFSANSGSSSFGTAGRFGQQQYSGGFAQSQSTPRPAAIVKLVNENPGDGNYVFSYETENGIQFEERGQARGDGRDGGEVAVAVQGAYAFTAPDDNVRYAVSYTADENGFQAYGAHLPTPPPVPAEIQRALEQNAADEARGIVDDGQYRAEQHGGPLQRGGVVRGSSGSAGYGSTGSSFNAGSGSTGSSFNAGSGYNSGSSGSGSFNAGSGGSSFNAGSSSSGFNAGSGSSGSSFNAGSGSTGSSFNSGSSSGFNSGGSSGFNSGSNGFTANAGYRGSSNNNNNGYNY